LSKEYIDSTGDFISEVTLTPVPAGVASLNEAHAETVGAYFRSWSLLLNPLLYLRVPPHRDIRSLVTQPFVPVLSLVKMR
jgi:hypothetical protein